MGKGKKYKGDDELLKTVTIRVPVNMAKCLKSLCISMSKQEGRVVSVSEFIRNTMVQFCPKEKQMDFASGPVYSKIKKYKPRNKRSDDESEFSTRTKRSNKREKSDG